MGNIQESTIRKDCDRVKVNSGGTMERSMKETGERARNMVSGSGVVKLEISMKGIGSKEGSKAEEFTLID